MKDLEEIKIKELKTYLVQYLYWHIESAKNLMAGNFTSILSETFMIEKKHQIAICYEKIKDLDIDWGKLYNEAIKIAEEKWHEENKEQDQQ